MAFSGNGSGTASDPYLITTLSELNEIRDDLTAYYELANDIDASPTTTWNAGAGWEPIGINVDGQQFTGHLNGNGKIISNLYINRSTSRVGFFGYIYGGSAEKLGIWDADITGTGGLYYGVFVAEIANSGSIEQCSVAGSLTGNRYVGGFVGGATTSTTITDSYSAVDIDATSNDVGGFIGIRDAGATLSRCWANGVVPTDINRYGGFLGTNSGGSDSNCFWDTETSGVNTSAGTATGKTTAEMQQEATFTNYDFDTIWAIDENNDYPILRWTMSLPGSNAQVTVSPATYTYGYQK